jgi:hypothetical protein
VKGEKKIRGDRRQGCKEEEVTGEKEENKDGTGVILLIHNYMSL